MQRDVCIDQLARIVGISTNKSFCRKVFKRYGQINSAPFVPAALMHRYSSKSVTGCVGFTEV
jgi:hypothetical protein